MRRQEGIRLPGARGKVFGSTVTETIHKIVQDAVGRAEKEEDLWVDITVLTLTLS